MATISTTITPTSGSPSSNSTRPSTPSSTAESVVNATQPPQGCTFPSCPIRQPHDRGLYLSSCPVALSTASRRIFAPSIPPPDIIAAYERCIRYRGEKTDEEVWVTFHELHVEPLLGRTDAVWIAPVPMVPRDNDKKVGELADAVDGEADVEAEVCRHPFGLLNPPDKVWEAHRRLVLGEGDWRDEELVDTYAAKNGYYGEGLGEYVSMSPQSMVRRPRYCPRLAKERRIRKESEVKEQNRLMEEQGRLGKLAQWVAQLEGQSSEGATLGDESLTSGLELVVDATAQ